MALEQNLILDLPFDEANGSTVAYDFAQNRHDATVVDCSFVAGKQGNCINFDGEGYADVNYNVVPLSGSFTILAWVKANKYPDGYTGKRIGLFCNTDQVEGYRAFWIDVEPDSWGFFAIKKSGNRVLVYLDTQLIETIVLPFHAYRDSVNTRYLRHWLRLRRFRQRESVQRRVERRGNRRRT